MAETGWVTLVGAGPGDPGLLTLAGREAIASAEVVLYDRLVGDEILAMIPEAAERIDVGKNKGAHPTPQAEINQLLLFHARNGKRVVRLKGGDPFLFGRGAEELELLRDQGIPFRIVPGVTSALAAPAYAGIPATHRDFSSSLHILTGHGKDGRSPAIPYAELAKLSGTLVFLMSASTLTDICAELCAAGMDPDTPAAVVENGTNPGQRLVASSLATVADAARKAGCAPPAILVVGKVCALADRFAWTQYLPLWGRRILAVSSRATGDRLATRLRAHGCRVDEFAGINMTPLPQPEAFWSGVDRYAWIVLTSAYGAGLFFTEMRGRRLDVRRLARVKFAAIGKRTAEVAEERGIFPHFVPEAYNAACLAEGLADRVEKNDRILLYRAREGNPDLADILRRRGVAFDEIAAYETAIRAADAETVARKTRDGVYDAVAFASSSSVRAFAAAVPGADYGRITGICIGDTTAATARELGMTVVVSREASVDGMVELILERMGNTHAP